MIKKDIKDIKLSGRYVYFLVDKITDNVAFVQYSNDEKDVVRSALYFIEGRRLSPNEFMLYRVDLSIESKNLVGVSYYEEGLNKLSDLRK